MPLPQYKPALPLPTLPPARRSRAPVRHVVLPFYVKNAAEPLPDETIGQFLIRQGWAKPLDRKYAFPLPTICVVNGQPVPQRQWRRRRIRPTDVVEFWSRPWGKSGSGKSIWGIIGLVALAAFAPWAGAALLGAGTIGASLLSGAILMGGSLLISSLTAPKPGGQTANNTTSQVERLASVSASGNSAKLFQAIPVQYGRVKSFPDWAITPWSEFIGNDQYLNILLSVGLGKYSHETLYVDDTILWTSSGGVSSSFSGVSVDFYDPAERVTLFPTNVLQSAEVSGQTITTTPVGGFVANTAGTLATHIAVDLVFPGGLFHANADEETGQINLESETVVVKVEAQPVDDSGEATGSFTQIGIQTFTYATRNPQRASIKVPVAEGRYSVRVSRTTAPSTENETVDGVVWAGLRAFIKGTSTFPVSTVAVRIKASNQLTQSSSNRIGVLCTRKLDVWDADTQTFNEQTTRNPFWAVWDAATDTTYGIGRPPSKIDFQTLFDQATAADTRGDKFDYRFSTSVAAPDAMDTILRGSRSRHRWSGDVLTFVRDEWSDIPRMLLTDREIVRGTMSIEYALNVDDSADSVIVEYVDEDTWGPGDVQYPPNNSPTFVASNPTRIQLDGVVNRDHAYREAGFYYLQSQLRRVNVSLDTEHDGRMLGFGSRVRVQSELPLSWGSTGAIIGETSNTLTVSPAPTWAASGNHYISIRTKVGRQFGPVLCTQGDDAGQIVLDATDLASVETAQGMTLADALERSDGADDPSFDFGPSDARGRDCIVMTGRPSQDRVTLGLVVDDEDVHTTELGDVPVAPSAPALQDPKVPLIVNLTASFKQGVAEPTLFASWWPAAGAQYYTAQVSYDSGETWTEIYQGTDPTFTKIVDLSNLKLRVQGVGQQSGPFSSVDVDAPIITIAPGTVSDTSLQEGLQDYINNQTKDLQDEIRSMAQIIAAAASDQDAANILDKRELKTQINIQAGGLKGSVEEVLELVQTTDNKLVGAWLVTLDVNGHVSGVKAFNDGSTSSFIINTDIFQVALPGEEGGDPKPVFTIAEIDGDPTIVIAGTMIADSTITAQKMSVSDLSAISANFGNTIYEGVAKSQNGLMVIDFANNRMVFSDS